MTAVILVPRRHDPDRPRDRLWDWCRTYWQPLAVPIIEGWDTSDGPFNRSAAVNDAAARADEIRRWDVAIIMDADTVASLAAVQAAAELARRSPEQLVLPYGQGCRWMCSRALTDTLLGSDPRVPLFDARLTHANGTGRPDPYQGFRSGIVAVPRRVWDTVGGMDERFVGWGGEDDAFADACDTLCAPMVRYPDDNWLFHLWHPSARPAHRDPHYIANRARADAYRLARRHPERMLALTQGADT